jgi:hypothetical protein
MLGISIRENIGIGDKVQFSSLPENYFRATGKKLVDVSKAWIFDHNPFVERDVDPVKTIELWNWPKTYEWPRPRKEGVYLSNAEVWANLFGVPVVLNRPRLYRFEDFPMEKREKIFFHTHGKSNGILPDRVIEHVIKKYGPTGNLIHLRGPDKPEIGLPSIQPKSLWELAEHLSTARMYIGVDSGPSWVAACYPDVVLKKVRGIYQAGYREMTDWIPLEYDNHHAHWDDRIFQIHNTTEDDVGAFPTYRRL